MHEVVSFQSAAIVGTDELYRSPHSVVYRGYYKDAPEDSPTVILKQLNVDFPTPEQLARFRHEFAQTQALQGTGVIGAQELFRHENTMVMVLEDIGGLSLDRHWSGIAVPLAEFLPLALSIVDALMAVHQKGVIHKDINPSNIVWNSATKQVKLIDFGLSTELTQERSRVDSPAQLVGTLAYLAPEQTGRMNRAIDYRSDYYALGMTFYELLTGQLPLASNDPLEWVHWHIARTASPPHIINPAIPAVLSDIVLKLIAKTAENRYASLSGLRHDLQACHDQLRTRGEIVAFDIATHDIADTLHLPQQLYGREAALGTLLSAFDTMLEGQKSLVSVTGPAGIGKSSLVRELLKPIVAQRGFFVEGKFDQLDKGAPYASLVQAFRALIQMLLAKSDEQIAEWRTRLLEAVGPNAGVVADVIPELAWIIGTPTVVPALSAAENRNRFTVTFQAFVKVFCNTDHPLVIFLDDVQWADLSSLKLIEQLMRDPTTHHLQILVAYRDDEVTASAPVSALFRALESTDLHVTRISLNPLEQCDVEALLAEALHCKRETVGALAQLVVEKTLGNPYFINQFLHSLYQQSLLSFSQAAMQWTWDTDQIAQAGITDNVIELMVDKLREFPEEAQHLLCVAACIGNEFDLESLAAISRMRVPHAAATLLSMLRSGLLLPLNDAYKWTPHLNWQQLENGKAALGADTALPRYRFAHDRVQQAAYSLLPSASKAGIHYQIGNALGQDEGYQNRGNTLFEVAKHFYLARTLFTTSEDRLRYVDIQFKAGQRAKSSAAFGPAMRYYRRGLSLLPENSWKAHYSLTLQLHTGFAEMAYINGDYTDMHATIDNALKQTTDQLDQVPLFEIRILALIAQHQSAGAVTEAVDTLRRLGIALPDHPEQSDIEHALGETTALLASTSPQALADLPLMTDPQYLAAIRIMNRILSASYQSSPQLFPILVFIMVQLSCRHGNTQGSTYAYATYGIISCGFLGDYETGYRFGKLALKLVDQLSAENFRAKSSYVFAAFLQHWKEPIADTLPVLRDSYQSGLATGDFEFAGWAAMMTGVHAFFAGETLPEIEKVSKEHWSVIDQLKQQTAYLHFSIFLQAIANLQNDSDHSTSLTGSYFDEHASVQIFLEAGDRTALFIVYFNRLVLSYLMGDHPGAAQAATEGELYLDGVVSSAYVPLFYFYAALAGLAQSRETEKLQNCIDKMAVWAKHSPVNYEHRLALLTAELARISGDHSLATIEVYQSAIDTARKRGFLQDEALGNELLAAFFEQQEQPDFVQLYLTKAYHLYRFWGAEAKLWQLRTQYQSFARQLEVSHQENLPGFMDISHAQPASALDSMSVIKASQAISSEIQFERLLQKLMTVVIENAGARRGYLLLANENDTTGVCEWTIEAEAVMGEMVEVQLSRPIDFSSDQSLPTTILQYVARTREPVILGETMPSSQFSSDPYLQHKQPASVLCAPILRRSTILGMIYLENSLASNAFTPEHMQTIQFLAAQTAISLENASLYSHLEARVAQRTRELNEANEKLTYLATTDSLTQAFSRHHFLELATQELHRTLRFNRPLVIMMIDIDHFKKINDTYGHAVGDQALLMVASIIRQGLRDLDIFGRLGGEEFAVLVPETTLEEGLQLAERLRALVEKTAIESPPHSFHVTISIGLSAALGPDATIISLLQQADKGLYKAKRNARNRTEIG
ncbi:diguanylate cyclase [Allohahella marinimesophila]|uniref:AAA family ATPase n=1 Tax=Allohahella marinimesophila TaxID=1054972 RepID=A0ABP7PZ41_9GAMM